MRRETGRRIQGTRDGETDEREKSEGEEGGQSKHDGGSKETERQKQKYETRNDNKTG